MKKNRLYTANRWNRPAFMHVFDEGGNTDGGNAAIWDRLASKEYGAGYGDAGKGMSDYMSSKNWLGISKENNPFSKGNLMSTFSKEGIGKMMNGGLGSGIASTVGGIAGNLIGGGYESGVGKLMGSAGKLASALPGPYGMVASFGLQTLGGVANALFGTKVDQARLNAANEGTSAYNGFRSNASSLDAITGPTAQANVQDAYSGGVFRKGWARDRNEALRQERTDARQLAFRSIDNNVDNLMDDQMNNALANYAAFGGPIESTGIGAVDYDFMKDYLLQKKRDTDARNKMGGISSMPAFMPQRGFAFGGDLQTNGSDFPSRLVHINAGQSHELNPNEGVQVGTDNEGVPNLVEENETIWNDYVFSARIPIDQKTKELFHIGKKREMTYADLSKKLEKEIAERPNDPVSKAGFEKQMEMLEQQQERQKQEMEAERAKAAFDALSPEEQTALMQQRAEQEAMTQQQDAMQEAAAQQQPTPEELAIAQQQQQMADGSVAALGQEPQMAANGGKLFSKGGETKKRIYKLLGIHTDSEFNKWAKDNDIPAFQDRVEHVAWDRIFENTDFVNAISKNNPALKDALTKGYDFGAYQPIGNGKATIQSISKGNWKTTNGKGWRGSDDLAFKQATEGLSDAEIDALTTEQLAERMRKTAAYQNTNKWLQNSDNALQYLNTLLNDPDTPEVAREYARKFVKDGKWKDGFNYDYATVFGSNGNGVRETNPGTYWHTALEANRGNQTGNFVINEDGTIEPIIGDVPTDWTSAGNYAWSDENNDYAYNYYKRPVVTTPSPQLPTEEETPEGTKKKIVPDLKKETYFGLLGPAVGLGLMGLGVGKPDMSEMDRTLANAARSYHTATNRYLGNYLKYQPLDIWFNQAKMDAQSRATDRALMNTSGGNRGTAMAGLLANGYNSQLASGDLFRQAQEYNDNLRKQVAEFNRGTDQFNAEAFNRLSQFNASEGNRYGHSMAQLGLNVAQAKDDANRWWASNLYGNINGLFDNINQWEKWKRDHNSVARMAANGVFGVGTEDTPVFGGYVKEDKKGKRSAANGGKLKKKKRGLTI